MLADLDGNGDGGRCEGGRGFPLEAEDDVAAVENDVGAAVGGPNPQGDSIRESEEIFTAKTPRMTWV